MKTKARFHKIVSLLLVLCLLLSFCSVLTACKKDKGGDDNHNHTNNDNNNDNGNDNVTVCQHTNTTLIGKKDAICITDGYTGDVVCTDCTAIVTLGTVIPKTGVHTYNEGTVTKQATCISEGFITKFCTGCGQQDITTTPTVAHQDNYHDNGAGQHIHTCTVCTLKENGEHTPTDAGVFFAATCTEDAYTEYTCADCKGLYKVYDKNTALSHSFSAWELTDSTCMEAGHRSQYCTRPECNEVNTVTLPKVDECVMVFVGYENDQAPDCSHEATALYACKWCGAPGESKTVAATGLHVYGEPEINGDGWVRKTCTVDGCGNVTSSYDASTLTETTVSTENIDTNESLEMAMKEAAIEFPSTVVSDIASGENLAVSAGVLGDDDKNTAINKVQDETTKTLLTNAPIYDFTVAIDGNPYKENFSEKVAITIPYEHAFDDAEGLVIYYLAENGTVETITEVIYNAEKKEISFFVNHFSYYAVAYAETQEMRCKRGNHDYVSTGKVVEATCYSFGYTEYECSGCGRPTFDDIEERLPHDFDYDNVVAAHPTCENGSWSYAICKNDGCGATNNIQFYGSLGHTMDHPASCTEASTCTTCHQVLARPLGHTWTAWIVTKQPTEISTGIRYRSCLTCGEEDTDELATTGTIEALQYNTYAEFVTIMLEEILNLSNGTLTVETSSDGEIYTLDLKVMKKDNGYRMSVVINSDRDGERREFYYDNGVFVYADEYEGYGIATEIDNIIPISIAVYKEIVEEIFVQLDDYAMAYLSMAKQMIDQYKEAYGADINEVLASAGLPYTVDNIDDLINSVESVYAYLALKLGLTTSAEVKNSVTLPSRADFMAVLELITTTEKNAISTTYTLSSKTLYDLVDGLIAFTEEHAEDTLADFIYFTIKDAALEYDASLTSFNAIIDLIARNFPGTFTVADAVSKYTDFATEAEFMSLEQLCEVVDMLVAAYTGGPMDSAALIDEYSTLSIDQLIQMMSGDETASINDLYTMLKESAAAMKLSDLVLPNGMSLAQITTMLKAYKEAINLDFGLSLTLDNEGKLVALTMNESLSVDMTGGEGEPTDLGNLSISIKHDNSVKVDVPASLQSVMADITTSYDSEGNLVIEGLNPDVEYNFDIEGNGKIDLNEALVLDEAMSNLYGVDIYVLKDEYKNDSDCIAHYLSIGGKYYSSDEYAYCSLVSPKGSPLTFDAFKAEIASGVSENGYKIGYLTGTEIPVYEFSLSYDTEMIGIAYKENGVWMVATRYGRVIDNSDDEFDNGYNGDMGFGNVTEDKDAIGYAMGAISTEKYDSYYAVNPMTLDSFITTVKLGITTSYSNISYNHYVISYGGVNYPSVRVTVSYGDGQSTNVRGFYRNNQLFIVNRYNYIRGANLYNIAGTPEITYVPEHDFTNTSSRTIAYYNEAGIIEFATVEQIDYYKLKSTYYLKVADGIYTEHNKLNGHGNSSIINSLNTDEKETLDLPDGNTLYILGRTMDNKYGYKYGYETVYGYAKIESGVYIQTAALVFEGEIVDVLYNNAGSEADTSFYNTKSLDGYVTFKDGVCTISAEIINELNALCQSEKTVYYFRVYGYQDINSVEIEYMYIVGGKINMPEIDLDDIQGTFGDDHEFWNELFGNDNSNESPNASYEVIANDDGSITLILPWGTTIENVSFNTNAEFPADNLWVKNEELSAETGLNIYTVKRSYTVEHSTKESYIYKNGKYYTYYPESNFSFSYVENLNDLKLKWYIEDTYYRFNMVGQGELPADLRVYETEVAFTYRDCWYGTHYTEITLYTFFLNGILQVATEADTSGESLLTFESYMPIDQYMNSLVLEVTGNSEEWDNVLVNGVRTKIYKNYFSVYEVTADGDKIIKADFEEIHYVLVNGVKKFIVDYSDINTVLRFGNEVEIDPTGKTRYEQIISYSNGTFTHVYFTWTETVHDVVNFIELAGRMYRYDSSDYYWWWNNTYLGAKISEEEFNYVALDKAWFYAVIDSETGDETYYTEFIPSDYGFTPSGDTIDPSEIKHIYDTERTLLGYTADGDALYEISYYVEVEDTTEWTEETQADGTVFLHKNGAGYLEVTEKNGEKYYVKARKVTMADGSEQIYCFLLKGVLVGTEIGDFVQETLNGYITYSGNTITITPEFFEIAKNNNRNEFYVYFSTDRNSIKLTYYKLEALFVLAENGGGGVYGDYEGGIEIPVFPNFPGFDTDGKDDYENDFDYDYDKENGGFIEEDKDNDGYIEDGKEDGGYDEEKDDFGDDYDYGAEDYVEDKTDSNEETDEEEKEEFVFSTVTK